MAAKAQHSRYLQALREPLVTRTRPDLLLADLWPPTTQAGRNAAHKWGSRAHRVPRVNRAHPGPLVLLAHPALPARRALQVLLAPKVTMVLPVQMDQLALPAPKALKGRRVLRDLQVQLVPRDRLVLPDHRALSDRRVHRDPQVPLVHKGPPEYLHMRSLSAKRSWITQHKKTLPLLVRMGKKHSERDGRCWTPPAL